MSLVETSWLEKNIENVKIIDCSWHLPSANRNPHKEYLEEHIPSALFFDLDKNSEQDTDLPHMLVGQKSWDKIVSDMGIEKNDKIVVYDNSDVVSSCRGWFNFIYFGHDPKLISVLNGGLKKWLQEKKEVTNITPKISKSDYKSFERRDLVKNKKAIDQNIKNKTQY